MSRHSILLLNGPNLNLLGSREPGLYGADTLADIELRLQQEAESLDISVSCFQSNAEHRLVERIHAAAGEAIDLTPGNTVIKYSDKNQTYNMNDTSEFTATNVAAFGDTDTLLEIGEVFEINLLTLNTTLSQILGTSTEFTIELVPPSGAVLFIGRRTPVSLDASMNLN